MQKIAIFSLTTSKPMIMSAVFRQGALVVTDVKPLPVSAMEQRKKIPSAIDKLRKNNFKVLVDEITPTVSTGTGASQVTLKTRHADGRAAIIVGMERYRELKQQRLLSLPASNKGAYEIPDSIVDIEYNGNGEEVYRVNWQDIRPEHILMILCCFATVYHNVASADYVSQMVGVTEEAQAPGLLASFFSILKQEKAKAQSVQPESLAGKRMDDDTVIL
ncbi:maturation control protein (plasmid) [Raoultella ornithinolytica]|uniref:maturation control protein n=1 Tax=Raoultella ornithinolytica TaxID=54291 RepID=UPI00292AE080|nr:maturation control protein [Raoultella ornithinolytica]MDV1094987.1 maturation control protein [Raoultella ornithinolytica]MDV1122669.1 maturation control protein [Raoultella ornithinolytica]MDV1893184.1 maturation control protein [Raoultella ornithinolytica]